MRAHAKRGAALAALMLAMVLSWAALPGAAAAQAGGLLAQPGDDGGYPTETPTAKPTESPTMKPTRTPTVKPTESPTMKPTETVKPTESPTMKPTRTPTVKPTESPTMKPSPTPSPKLPVTGTGSLAVVGAGLALLGAGLLVRILASRRGARV